MCDRARRRPTAPEGAGRQLERLAARRPALAPEPAGREGVTQSFDLERLRAETPGCASGRIHFNNAGAGLMPRPVLEAVHGHLALEADIGGYEAADERREQSEDFYAAAAELLNADPRNVAFANSATDAYARALSSIPFRTGDVVVTTRDDYVSNQIAFLSLQKRYGVEIVRAPTLEAGGVDPEAMCGLVETRRPRLVAVTHIPTNSGLVQPIEAIGACCRALGSLYLVDACQSIGQYPLDVETIGCGFLTATCRKFLRGPRGSGLLFVSDEVLESGYEPLFIDMRGAHWVEPDRYEPVETAARFEDWEFGYATVIGTAVAIRYALRVGVDEIGRRCTALGTLLRSGLRELLGARVLDRGERLCAIVTFEADGVPGDQLVEELRLRGINSSASLRDYALLDFGDKNVVSCVRLSPHYYNTEEEVEVVLSTVAEVLRR